VAGPRRQAPAGQVVSPANPTDAQMMCGSGYGTLALTGLTATSMPPAAPAIRITRPGSPAGRSANPVTR
jgi:hypothetical protein